MSYGVSLESMLIPDTGNRYYPDDLLALENWIIDMESAMIADDVAYYAAMEAEGGDASEAGAAPSSFITRIRTAFNNMRAGKKKGDEAAVSAAAQEIKEASDEFSEESGKETDPEKKKKWKKAAAIIAAIVAAAALAIGATALAKKAKGKANSGNVSNNEVAGLLTEGVKEVKNANSDKVVDPDDRPKGLPAGKPQYQGPSRKDPPSGGDTISLPAGSDDSSSDKGGSNDNGRKALPAGQARLALPAGSTGSGTGASTTNADGEKTPLLSREEKRAANRTAQYTTQNPAGTRAERRAKNPSHQETPMEKRSRLLRESVERKANSGGTVTKEEARRVQNAEKRANRQATASAHQTIAKVNAIRGEMKKGGVEPSDNVTPPQNQSEIQGLLSKVNGHFARMKQAGGLQVKQTGNSTFYKRTKQGDQAKVFKKEIDGMAQAIAELTKLGYNGDAIDMYNQLKKAQK